MRYRIDPSPSDATAPVTHDLLVATAVLGLLIGVGLVIAGLRGRQHWLAAWGSTLVVASVIYVGAVFLGFG